MTMGSWETFSKRVRRRVCYLDTFGTWMWGVRLESKSAKIADLRC
jgi:hypothetical protein